MTVELIYAEEQLPGGALYHFTSFDLERLAQIVRDGLIYFSRPAEFNDPFELSPVVDLESLENSEIRERWVNAYAASIKSQIGDAALNATASQLEAARHSPDIARKLLAHLPGSLVSFIQNKYRVYCLSTELRSVRMWSHYAAKHRGVAFEFSSDGAFFGKACLVDYPEVPTPVGPDSGDGIELYVRSLLTKASSWRHEHEYRIIACDLVEAGFVQTTNGIAQFPLGELKAVYVGCNMPSACIRAILNETSARPTPLPVRRMRKVPHSLMLDWSNAPPT